jgi:hypothetical protein
MTLIACLLASSDCHRVEVTRRITRIERDVVPA